MRTIAVFFMMVCWALAPLAHAQDMTLAYVDFPPYEYEENGEPKGILVDIVKTIFQRTGISLTLEFAPFARAYKETQDGKIDGLFNFYKTEERLALFDYSEPVITNPLVLFVQKESTVTFNGKLEDLKGLKVGAMVGYTYGTEFDNTTLFTIDRVTSHEINFKKLLFRRIDAYPCDKLVGVYVARKENVLSEVKILPTPLKVMEGHIGFLKGKNQENIAKINAVIQQMKQAGEIEQMIDQYLGNL